MKEVQIEYRLPVKAFSDDELKKLAADGIDAWKFEPGFGGGFKREKELTPTDFVAGYFAYSFCNRTWGRASVSYDRNAFIVLKFSGEHFLEGMPEMIYAGLPLKLVWNGYNPTAMTYWTMDPAPLCGLWKIDAKLKIGAREGIWNHKGETVKPFPCEVSIDEWEADLKRKFAQSQQDPGFNEPPCVRK